MNCGLNQFHWTSCRGPDWCHCIWLCWQPQAEEPRVCFPRVRQSQKCFYCQEEAGNGTCQGVAVRHHCWLGRPSGGTWSWHHGQGLHWLIVLVPLILVEALCELFCYQQFCEAGILSLHIHSDLIPWCSERMGCTLKLLYPVWKTFCPGSIFWKAQPVVSLFYELECCGKRLVCWIMQPFAPRFALVVHYHERDCYV